MPSLTPNELNALTRYLSKPEREELEQILAAMPEPLIIIEAIIRPDRSIEAYLRDTPTGLEPVAADDPLIADWPPATPEVNGGLRIE